MKKVSVSCTLFVIAVTVGLLFFNADIQAQPSNHESGASHTGNVVEKTGCRNLTNFLKAEFRDRTRPEVENPGVRLYGLQKKDALPKALELCAKLKAKKIDNDDKVLKYELPEGLGFVIVREIDEDGIFVKLSFETDCDSLPFEEVWYVSLSRYNRR